MHTELSHLKIFISSLRPAIQLSPSAGKRWWEPSRGKNSTLPLGLIISVGGPWSTVLSTWGRCSSSCSRPPWVPRKWKYFIPIHRKGSTKVLNDLDLFGNEGDGDCQKLHHPVRWDLDGSAVVRVQGWQGSRWCQNIHLGDHRHASGEPQHYRQAPVCEHLLCF